MNNLPPGYDNQAQWDGIIPKPIIRSKHFESLESYKERIKNMIDMGRLESGIVKGYKKIKESE